MGIRINEESIAGKIPAYLKYDSQHEPQSAAIYMTAEGEVGVRINGDIGNAIPSDEYHNRTLTWRIPPNVFGESLRSFLHDEETLAMLEKIHEGHSVKWDGNNMVGHLSHEASETNEKFQSVVEDLFADEACAEVWTTEQYLIGTESAHKALILTLGSGTVEEAVDSIIAEIETQKVVLEDFSRSAISDAIVSFASSAIEEGYYDLTRTQYDDLIAHGLDREKLLSLLAVAVVGNNVDDPKNKEVLSLADWTGYRIFIDEDGEITGRIVTEKEIAHDIKKGETLETLLVGDRWCIDLDDLPTGAVVENGVVLSGFPSVEEESDRPGPS